MRRTLKFLAVAAAAAMPALAGAQQIHFVGSTVGCFYQGPGGNCAPTNTAAVGGGALTYNWGTFNFYTNPAGLSGTSYGAVGNNTTTNSHGTLTSTGVFTSSVGSNQWFLRLQTTVTSPGLTSNVFTNDFSIRGSTGISGGLHFDPLTSSIYTGIFTNGEVLGYPYPATSASGTVDAWDYDNQSLTGGSVATPNTVALSSFLQITSNVTTTPEPATVGLMLSGLVGMIGAGFIRRRNAA